MALRVVFEFGSDTTKVAVVHCPHAPARPLHERKLLLTEEAEVLLGHNVNASPDRVIDAPTCERLYATTKRLCALVDRAVARFREFETADASLRRNPKPRPMPPLEIRGLCTAVYREAANGPDVMRQLRRIVGSDEVRVVTQAEEGRAGYLIGVAALAAWEKTKDDDDDDNSDSDYSDAVVWTCGAFSFQITGLPLRRSADGEPELSCVHGNWGSSKAMHALLTAVRGMEAKEARGKSPNPVSMQDCARLATVIEERLAADRILTSHDEWLPGAVATRRWVAVGGLSCPFRMAAIAVHGIAAVHDQTITLPVRMQALVITKDQLDAALASVVCGKSDAELAKLGFVQPEMVASKIVLVLTVMRVADRHAFTYFLTGEWWRVLGFLTFDPSWAPPDRSAKL